MSTYASIVTNDDAKLIYRTWKLTRVLSLSTLQLCCKHKREEQEIHGCPKLVRYLVRSRNQVTGKMYRKIVLILTDNCTLCWRIVRAHSERYLWCINTIDNIVSTTFCSSWHNRILRATKMNEGGHTTSPSPRWIFHERRRLWKRLCSPQDCHGP